LERVSIIELRRHLSNLRAADFRTLTDDAVRYRIGRIINDYPFQIRPLELNGLYRARPNRQGELFTAAHQLWYPPATAIVRPSRMNRPGQVLFYASSMPNTAVYEIRAVAGDVVTVLLARTRSSKIERCNVPFIGLERALAPEVAGLRPMDMFRTSSHFQAELGPGNYRKWLEIDDYLSEIFARPVVEGEEHLYKPCIGLADWLFTAERLDAVTYPSVAAYSHGVNICMLPAKADAMFTPLEAWMIGLTRHEIHPDTGEELTRIEFLRRSHEIGPDGVIAWRAPGQDINDAEIRRFARSRVLNLPAWPRPA
jgi:hypothetical protein